MSPEGHPKSPNFRSEFLAGVRDLLPILLGVMPFGLIFGALAISVGIPPLAAQFFSLLVFAGSAQFIAVGLIGEMAPVIVIVVTIFVVNLRHALYSASMSPHFAPLSMRWKLSLSWLLTDEAFATATTRYQRGNTDAAHWYTLGTGLALWSAWQISTALGILLGGEIPTSFPLAFALPLTFIALLVPTLRDRPTVAAAASAGVIAVLLSGLPLRLGLLMGAVAGIGIGLWIDRKAANVQS
ncbi:MAG: AzlC family ABC transporter permease [Chloroflexi bacterium]|nr:AzlC family ABC transporter permease [Chloroflexota bacterium]